LGTIRPCRWIIATGEERPGLLDPGESRTCVTEPLGRVASNAVHRLPARFRATRRSTGRERLSSLIRPIFLRSGSVYKGAKRVSFHCVTGHGDADHPKTIATHRTRDLGKYRSGSSGGPEVVPAEHGEHLIASRGRRRLDGGLALHRDDSATRPGNCRTGLARRLVPASGRVLSGGWRAGNGRSRLLKGRGSPGCSHFPESGRKWRSGESPDPPVEPGASVTAARKLRRVQGHGKVAYCNAACSEVSSSSIKDSMTDRGRLP